MRPTEEVWERFLPGGKDALHSPSACLESSLWGVSRSTLMNVSERRGKGKGHEMVFRICFYIVVMMLLQNSAVHAARCTGSTYCSVCTDCSQCQHCKYQGGSCGVCAPPPAAMTSSPQETEPTFLEKLFTYLLGGSFLLVTLVLGLSTIWYLVCKLFFPDWIKTEESERNPK